MGRVAVVARHWMFGLPVSTVAWFLVYLVALDSLATILTLREQLGIEMNPAMGWLMGQGEATFLLVRLGLVGFCALWVIRHADHRYSRYATLVGLAIFLPVLGLHVYNQYLFDVIGARQVLALPRVVPCLVSLS